MDHLLNHSVTIKAPNWAPDSINAPKLNDSPTGPGQFTTLYTDVPCRQQDSWDMQVNAWGQEVLKNVSLFFLRDPGPVPGNSWNGLILTIEGRNYRVTGQDTRRRMGGMNTYLVVRGEVYTP